MTKNATRSNRQSWGRLAAAVGLTIGLVSACGSDGGTSTTAAPAATVGTSVAETTAPEPDPCDGYGTLQVNELNDHCVETSNFADSLESLGLWVDSSCPNGALVVAQPNEVLVTVSEPGNLGAAVDRVTAALKETDTDANANGNLTSSLAQVINVPGLAMADVLNVLPALQGEGWSADLNYLEPLQPNDGFRPSGEPHEAGVKMPEPVPGGVEKTVLVLDSTDDESQYDIGVKGNNLNGLVDEDHAHGVFVKSIIERQAAGAKVTLQGVASSSPRLASDRWVPMMFSDLDLITAMEAAFSTGTGAEFEVDKQFNVVNLSLGGAGCTDSSAFAHGVGERVALARMMASLLAGPNSDMKFVAAAGNDHGVRDKLEFKHFPAAWRDSDATELLAKEVDKLPNGVVAGDELRAIHALLTNAMFAVGASDASGASAAEYSNCGTWVNAVAPGTDQIGTYWKTTAKWSGTSFATANMSALVAAGQSPTGTLPC